MPRSENKSYTEPSSIRSFEPASSVFEEMHPNKPVKSSSVSRVLIVLLVIIIILVVIGVVGRLAGWNIFSNNQSDNLSQEGWQAVFLDNGPVYFGRIAAQSNDLLYLDNVFYLDFSQPLQPTGQEATTTPDQTPSLVRLGDGRELHQPMNKMTINMDHIILIEELKADSEVVAAILRYQQETQP